MPKVLFRKTTGWFLLLVIVSNFVLSACRTKQAPDPVVSFKGIILNYYKVFDDDTVMKPLLAKFQASHPGLQINYRSFTDLKAYQSVILNEMAEGAGPDVFSMPNTWFASNYKKISPMPESVGTMEFYQKLFVDVALKDLVRVNSAGLENIYGLPLTVDTLALYYNKAHFEDRIPSPGLPATTWEGIKENVALLNKPDQSLGRFNVSGIAMGRADNIDRAADILYLLFLQYGVNFYNPNLSEATFAAQSSSAAGFPGVEALKFFTSFADSTQKHYSWNQFVVEPSSYDKEVEAFAKGKVSMIVGYSYTYAQIASAVEAWKSKGVSVIKPENIGITQIPQIFDPDVSKEKRITYASYFAETVSRNSKHAELAWQLLAFLSKKDNLQYYFDKTHKPTSRRDMIEDQKKDPIYGVFASQVGYAESFPIVDYYLYKDLFSQVIAKANEKNANSADLLDAQSRITQLLPQEGLIFPKKTQVESAKTTDAAKK